MRSPELTNPDAFLRDLTLAITGKDTVADRGAISPRIARLEVFIRDLGPDLAPVPVLTVLTGAGAIDCGRFRSPTLPEPFWPPRPAPFGFLPIENTRLHLAPWARSLNSGALIERTRYSMDGTSSKNLQHIQIDKVALWLTREGVITVSFDLASPDC